MEVNLNEADYNKGIGSQNGKAFAPIGEAPALSRDLNESTNNYLYIGTDRKVHNKKITQSTAADGKF